MSVHFCIFEIHKIHNVILHELHLHVLSVHYSLLAYHRTVTIHTITFTHCLVFHVFVPLLHHIFVFNSSSVQTFHF